MDQNEQIDHAEHAAVRAQADAENRAELAVPLIPVTLSLTPAEYGTLLSALQDAADYREKDGDCGFCDDAANGVCEDHEHDDVLRHNYDVLLEKVRR